MNMLDKIIEAVPFVHHENTKDATFVSVMLMLPVFTILGWGLKMLGAIPVLIFVFKLMNFLWRHLFRRRLDLKKRYGENSWACITGSTSGIGEYFAVELAKEGFNLVLLGRNEKKLKITKEIMKTINHKIKIETVLGDFEKDTGIDFYKNLADQINKFDVSIFISNAGYGMMGDMLKVSDKELKSIVDTNCLPYVMLTRYIGEKMYVRAKRSAIIHLGSIEAVYPMPGGITYSATKAFDDFFSRGVRYELKDKVDVMCLRPSTVSTKGNGTNPGFMVIKPEDCVKGTLRDLGRETYTYANWQHELTIWFLHVLNTILPEALFLSYLHKLNMEQLPIQREHWIKNDTAEAKKDLSLHEPKKVE